MSRAEDPKEISPKGESNATQKIVELLKRRLAREYPQGDRTLRDAHPKQHGLVRAHFIVEPDLPADLRIGLFAEPKSYPAWVRFSNMSDPPGPDFDPDSRGMAIKLMEVDGEKLLDRERHERTHDFVLMSSTFFVTKDVAAFAALVEALERGRLSLLAHLVLRPRLLSLFLRIRRRCASVLETTFGSTTPYLFGSRAVKYVAQPAGPCTATIPAEPSENFLRDQMADHLANSESCFNFFIQFQTDTRRMPIEDPQVEWDESQSPLIKVATIRIPAQKFNTSAQHEFGDNLSFTPWHALPAHRPLGGINRARKIIYETMSEFRHDRNQARRREPTGWNDFESTQEKV